MQSSDLVVVVFHVIVVRISLFFNGGLTGVVIGDESSPLATGFSVAYALIVDSNLESSVIKHYLD